MGYGSGRAAAVNTVAWTPLSFPSADRGHHSSGVPLLFVLSQSLAWSVYTRRLEEALARRTDIAGHVMHVRRYQGGLRPFIKNNNAIGLHRLYRRLDPITASRLLLASKVRSRLAASGARAIHFCTHYLAGALDGTTAGTPVTAMLDHTREIMERDLPRRVWCQGHYAREADLIRRLNHVDTLSEWAATGVSDLGVARDRITVFLPPINLGHFVPNRRTPRPLPNVVFIGGDFLRKGGDRLVSWIRGPLAGRCTLHIISGDPAAPASEPNIINHGKVDNTRLLNELLPEMDVMCKPTRSDMSSFVTAEAAAAGIPTVASDIAGIPELIRHGETGFLVPRDDDDGFIAALKTLVDNPRRMHSMGERARELAVARFDAQRSFDALFDRMLALAASNNDGQRGPLARPRPAGRMTDPELAIRPQGAEVSRTGAMPA
jgi:glycosyltransferase involved in cell wall biosynthesis